MYNEIILNLFNNPTNAGKIVKPDGVADAFNADKTQHVEFFLRIESGIITDCKFRAQANPYIVAVCDTIADMACGKMVSMLFIDASDVKKALKVTEGEDITFCIDCIKLAAADYFTKQEKKNKRGE